MRHFARMQDRVEIEKDKSDKDYFDSLMYYGELLLKTIVSGFVACIVDNKERMKYAQEYKLVRDDGIGGWASSLNEIVIGPTSSHLIHQIRDEKNEFAQKVKSDDWRHKAVTCMNNALCIFVEDAERIGVKTTLRRLFEDFAFLRNKTRGHGAHRSGLCTAACKDIDRSLQLVVENCSLLNNVEWAYLHQNLSGKYRVIKISPATDKLDELKRGRNPYSTRKLEDGVYLCADKPRPVSLMYTNIDLTDFFFPNGSFKKDKFETISYISGKTQSDSTAKYLLPIDELPPSETRGLVGFTVQGELFGNLPDKPSDYINRIEIESEVREVLKDERNPVITLVGRGGIGKTSTALSVLHEISELEYFNLAVWFSARDIDLLPDGAKPVRPDILTIEDMAAHFVSLVDPDERHADEFNNVEYFKKSLNTLFEDKPSVFIFDNFETLKEPVETYKWINTNIRLPNKVIITTRFRDFKGDYPIEIAGMTEEQAAELITSYSKKIGASSFIKEKHVDEIIKYSDGHPYIIKVLIGEIKRNKGTGGIKTIVASKDDMLEALFDRTYSNLSEAPRRVFLLLSNWRSYVPEVAVEAVMLRNSKEVINVSKAIDDLVNSSFVERHSSEVDDHSFLSVPLTASTFGRQKLSVSPYKLDIEQDTEILQFFGATQKTDLRHGLNPKIYSLVKKIQKDASSDAAILSSYTPMLEYIARRINEAWLMMSDMYSGITGHSDEAKSCIKKYIERESSAYNRRFAWGKMAELCKKEEDFEGEVHALLELVSFDNVEYETVSDVANRINTLLWLRKLELDVEKKEILVRKVAEIMYRRIEEASSDDCSRLAWLYLHLKNTPLAKDICEKGLALDQYNSHCHNLIKKINAH